MEFGSLLSLNFAGGIMLILGAYFLYKGNILASIVFYILGDIFWVVNTIVVGDIMGTLSISIATVLEIGVFYKMNKGIFVKNLNVKKKPRESKPLLTAEEHTKAFRGTPYS